MAHDKRSEAREEPTTAEPLSPWRKFVRWLVRKDAVIQQRPVNKKINEKAAKFIDPFVK